MITSNIVYKILWATIEDFDGLWEICWELNSLFPENSKRENQEMAKKISQYFLENGLVTFYISKWGSDDLKELHFEEAIKILEGEIYWDAPALNEICIKIGSTEKGEIFYNEELINDLDH
jgi:hypothetical protein